MFFSNSKKNSSVKKNNEEVVGFSHIGQNAKFEGEIDSKGEIEIAGKVKGNINAKIVKILETGLFKGRIFAKEVFFYGKVSGNVYSENVNVSKTGFVRSNIYYSGIFGIEDGANFSGKAVKQKKDQIVKSADKLVSKTSSVDKIIPFKVA